MGFIVVCDTGALISLEKLTDGFAFIGKLYDGLIVPQAVYAEYASGGDLEPHIGSGLVQVIEATVIHEFPGIDRLHQGEIEAISLALEFRNRRDDVLLLIEERTGREIALGQGLKISGIAGQIVKARRLGLIDTEAAVTHMQDMLGNGRIGRRLHARLVDKLQGLSQG